MIFNITASLLMLLITLYLVKQGALTAILTLITASFASFLAVGYFEAAGNTIVGWRPDYARGAAFMVLFLLAFGFVRLVSDVAVPKNVKLPGLADRIAGGFVGFFASMVIIGTLVVGIDMMPLGTKIMGFDRFSSETRMARDGNGRITGGYSVWFGPERFVTGMWALASGGSMGGGKSITSVHPDLNTESYGYRNIVEPGSNPSLLPQFCKLTGAYEISDPKQVRVFTNSDAEMKVEVIRVQTEQGGTPPLRAADADPFFRITPTQVRMVTEKSGVAQQYYPIGYMEKGTKFVATPLDTGHLVDDFPVEEELKKTLAKINVPGVDPSKLTITHDWVFAVPTDEKPDFVEIKQHTRLDMPGKLEGMAMASLDPIFYPRREYRINPAVVTVKVNSVNAYDKSPRPIAKADVWILQPTVQQRKIAGIADTARTKIRGIRENYETSSNGWGEVAAKENNLPPEYEFRSQWDRIRDELMLPQGGADAQVQWATVIPACLISELTPRPSQSMNSVNAYFDDTLVKLFNESKTLVERTGTGGDGTAQIKIAKGNYLAVIRVKTPEGLYFWVRPFGATDNQKVEIECSTGAVNFKVEPKKLNP